MDVAIVSTQIYGEGFVLRIGLGGRCIKSIIECDQWQIIEFM
jgi:hypothetical protein